MWGKTFKAGKSWTRVVAFSLIIVLSSAIGFVNAGEPGSDEDPLVSQSYVDSKDAGLKAENDELKMQNEAVKAQMDYISKQVVSVKNQVYELDAIINDLKEQNKTLKATVIDLNKKLEGADIKTGYDVIELKLGQKLIAGESTQIVLRSGTAKAIVSKAGGLADLTGDNGADIKSDQVVPKNHLLLIPRDDGRGIKITSTNAWVMIKGKYEIKDK